MIESKLSKIINRIEDNYGLDIGLRVVSFHILENGDYELIVRKTKGEENDSNK